MGEAETSPNNIMIMDPSNSSDSQKEIYRSIRSTRNRLDSTVDELTARLSPARLMDSFLAGIKMDDDTWKRQREHFLNGCKWTFHATAKQLKNHPGPSIIIGAGILWMLLDRKDKQDKVSNLREHTHRSNGQTFAYTTEAYGQNSDSDDYEFHESFPSRLRHKLSAKTHRLEETSHQLESTALSLKNQLKNKTQNTMDSIKETANSVAESASQWTAAAADKTRHATESISNGLKRGYWASEERYERALDKHPLALGAGAFALGLLASLALPNTRRENKMLGEKSHAAIAAAKRRGSELIEKGKAVAEEVTHNLKDEVQHAGVSSLRELAQDGKKIVAAKASGMIKEGMQSIKESAKDHNLGNKKADPSKKPASSYTTH